MATPRSVSPTRSLNRCCRYRVVIGKDARMLGRHSRLAPQRATDLIAKKMESLVAK